MDGDSLCKQQDKYEALFGLRDVRPFESLRGCNDFSVSFLKKKKIVLYLSVEKYVAGWRKNSVDLVFVAVEFILLFSSTVSKYRQL